MICGHGKLWCGVEREEAERQANSTRRGANRALSPIVPCRRLHLSQCLDISIAFVASHYKAISSTMAKGSASSPTATPPSAALKRTSSSTQNMKSQKSILGFFQKSSPATPSTSQPREPASSPAQRASEKRGPCSSKKTPSDQKRSFSSFAHDLSPVPSSDLPIPEEDENDDDLKVCPFVPSHGDRAKLSWFCRRTANPRTTQCLRRVEYVNSIPPNPNPRT